MSKLAEDHWGYVEEVLRTHGESEEFIEICGFHYRAAMDHGYKHGVEDMAERAKQRFEGRGEAG